MKNFLSIFTDLYCKHFFTWQRLWPARQMPRSVRTDPHRSLSSQPWREPSVLQAQDLDRNYKLFTSQPALERACCTAGTGPVHCSNRSTSFTIQPALDRNFSTVGTGPRKGHWRLHLSVFECICRVYLYVCWTVVCTDICLSVCEYLYASVCMCLSVSACLFLIVCIHLPVSVYVCL